MSRDEALQAIALVLFERWDPIGVRGFGGTIEEYRSYAPTVLRMLDQDCSSRDLALRLSRLARESMRLSAVDDNLHSSAAEALVHLRELRYRPTTT